MKTDSKAAVIQLGQISEQDEYPAYVAIYSTQPIDNVFVLSPAAMQWSQHVILNRLKDCESFWLKQQQKMQCDIESLFSNILSHHYGDEFIAVFACHPWQCLHYLSYQRHQQGRGVYFLQSRLNRNIYQTLGWSFWFDNQSQLSAHLESTNARGFNAARLRSRQSQLKAFTQRIGLNGPYDLQKADFQSFSRRFGSRLANIWRWTMTTSNQLQGFPWISALLPEQPSVARDLEYPVATWQVVEGLLREDLARLCESFAQNDQQHINRIAWQIRMFNEQTIEVNLCFRFPYSLHRDQPDFKTALYQARYVYDDLMRQMQARDQDLDLPETMPLVAWRLELCERFSLPPQIWDLFGQCNTELSRQDLFNLQNKLPVTIESYTYANSFYPEQSFQPSGLNTRESETVKSPLWSLQSINRPLFYYPSTELIDEPATERFTFLERSSSDWWAQQESEAGSRDYFRLKDATGRLSWVYRDFNGLWFKQGEYS